MLKQSDLDKMSLAMINAAIAERKGLINCMVGNLYPSIIWEEIDQLRERKAVIEQILKNEGKNDI